MDSSCRAAARKIDLQKFLTSQVSLPSSLSHNSLNGPVTSKESYVNDSLYFLWFVTFSNKCSAELGVEFTPLPIRSEPGACLFLGLQFSLLFNDINTYDKLLACLSIIILLSRSPGWKTDAEDNKRQDLRHPSCFKSWRNRPSCFEAWRLYVEIIRRSGRSIK